MNKYYLAMKDAILYYFNINLPDDLIEKILLLGKGISFSNGK